MTSHDPPSAPIAATLLPPSLLPGCLKLIHFLLGFVAVPCGIGLLRDGTVANRGPATCLPRRRGWARRRRTNVRRTTARCKSDAFNLQQRRVKIRIADHVFSPLSVSMPGTIISVVFHTFWLFDNELAVIVVDGVEKIDTFRRDCRGRQQRRPPPPCTCILSTIGIVVIIITLVGSPSPPPSSLALVGERRDDRCRPPPCPLSFRLLPSLSSKLR